MKPVDQTAFGPERGNCLTAAIASVLELPIDQVPYFNGAPDPWLAVDEFLLTLRKYGKWAPTCMPPPLRGPAGYAVAVGPSPRFENAGHACVALDGVVVHDPHPDRTGLPKITGYFVIKDIT